MYIYIYIHIERESCVLHQLGMSHFQLGPIPNDLGSPWKVGSHEDAVVKGVPLKLLLRNNLSDDWLNDWLND